MVVLNHPDYAQHILVNKLSNYPKESPFWDAARPLLGNGLVLSEGDFWRKQRRMMQPYFHKKYLETLTNLMVEAIEDSLSYWDSAAASNEPIDIQQVSYLMAMKVVTRTIFGSELSIEEADKLSGALAHIVDYLLVGMITNSIPNWLPAPGRKGYHQNLKVLDEITYKVIDRHRKTNGDSSCLIAMLLDAVDEETDSAMTSLQLRDEAVTLFVAGFETTAITIAWAFHLLTKHPTELKKVQTEIDTALQGQKPTFADLPNLKYTKMVIQEVLRLYPVSYWVPRRALEDDEIDGVHIPAGTDVTSMTYTIHHHPDIWEAPFEFDPERFSPERSANRHNFAWIPFGAGQRLCIGKEFSIMESQLIMAILLQRYTVSAVPGHVTKPKLSSSLKPANGVLVNLTPRV